MKMLHVWKTLKSSTRLFRTVSECLRPSNNNVFLLLNSHLKFWLTLDWTRVSVVKQNHISLSCSICVICARSCCTCTSHQQAPPTADNGFFLHAKSCWQPLYKHANIRLQFANTFIPETKVLFRQNALLRWSVKWLSQLATRGWGTLLLHGRNQEHYVKS
jgi:hypothetical protein